MNCVVGAAWLCACVPVDRDDVPDRSVRTRPVHPLPAEAEPDPRPEPAAPVAATEAGCFRPPEITPLEFSPNGSVTADVDGDAVLDFVTFRDELVDGDFEVHIDTYLGDRVGHFRRVSSAPYAKGGLGIAFDYIDDDAHLDMITGDHKSASFTEWMGDGKGGFSPAYTRRIGTSPHTPHLVDLDNDGRRDLIMPRYRMIEIYLSSGAGKYRPMPWIKVAKSKEIATPEGISLADLDADGNVDLIAPLSDDNALTVYMGRGDGKFRKHSRFEDPCASPQDSAVGHFDEDGHLDLAVGCSGTTILMYQGDGTGGLERGESLETPGHLVDLVAADVTGDGKVELIGSGYGFDGSDYDPFAERPNGYVVVFAREGDKMVEWSRVGVGMHYTHGLRVDDVDEDGRLDILFAGGGGVPGSHLGVLFGRPCAARG